VKGKDALDWRFRIPLDSSLPYGFAPVTVRARDGAGNSFGAQALLYVVDYAVAREEPGFRFSDPRLGPDGRILFGPPGLEGAASPVLGAFYGGDLVELALDPPSDLVALGHDGRTVSLTPAKEGLSAPSRIVGRTGAGRVFSGGPFIFATDSVPPSLRIDSPTQGAWFRDRIAVTGAAADAGGPVSLSWRRLPEGAGNPVTVAPDGSFSFSLSAADFPPGAFSIELEAKDPAGNASRACLSLGANAQAPAVRFLSPEKGSAVWGSEDIAARVEDLSGLASVEFAADGANFGAIDWKGSYFVHRADLAANPRAAYRLVDRAGNTTIARPEVVIGAPPALAPASASISVEPQAGEARIELAGSAGSAKAGLLLPGLSEAAFLALGDPGSAPPARFSTRLLVAGALSLKGQVTLEGQVKAVSLSRDGGATYLLLASSKDAKSAKSALPFSLSVDAARLPQGPARWAIKVEDFSGLSWFCPIFCLVDTRAPALSLLYPEKDGLSLPGPFPLVVKAEDESGIASGELATGTAKEGLKAEGGGRYFAVMVDPSSQAAGAGAKAVPPALSLSFTDRAGNQGQRQLKYGYAPDAPRIRLDSPLPDAKGLLPPLDAGSLVSGSASDADGPVPVSVSIDGSPAQPFPSGSFALDLPSLPAGRHLLKITAGGEGKASSSLTKDFVTRGPGPEFGELRIGDLKNPQAWAPGADFALGPSSLLMGRVGAPNGLASLSLAVNGGQPSPVQLGKAAGGFVPFSAALPPGLPYDRVGIELVAKDALGLSTQARLEIHKVLPAKAGSDDEESLRFADARILGSSDKPSLLLSPGDRLVGRFNGRPIARLALEPATAALKASFDGPIVTLEAAAEGLVPVCTLSLTTVDGDRFGWGPFSAAVDSGPPTLEISAPKDNDWTRGEVRVSGRAGDPQGLSLLQVSINGGEPLPFADPSSLPANTAIAFDRVLPLATAVDGATRLDFIARDGAGRETRVTRYINKDTLPPELSQVEPRPGESVNGLTTFVGEAIDAGRLASVVFLAAPGAKPEEVAGLGTFSRDLDLTKLDLPLPEGGGFLVTDKAGNQALFSPSVAVDKEKDKPVVEIHAPGDGEVLRGDFVISGIAYDDDGLAAAYYRLDGGPWSKLDTAGTSFSVPMALKDIGDNEHLVEVKAEDIYGVQGDIVSRKFRVSKEEPVAAMTGPPISSTVRGTVLLAGTASDANGIKDVSVSVDNRTSYDAPVGKDSWSLGLDTTTLSDGIHAVAVRPVDGYDTEGFYASMVSVDNTPPRSMLDLPRDGDEVAGSLAVSGRVSDNIAIASSRIEVAAIGAASPPKLVVDLGTDKIAQRVIDLSGLAPGAYTVRLVVKDRADNEALAARDITVTGGAPADSISVVFPVEGEKSAGRLRVQGRARVASGAGPVSVLADGRVLGSADPDALGWYSFEIPTGALGDGLHRLKARTITAQGRAVESPETRISWSALGPWISIDSIPSGKYLAYRPYLSGKAGWMAEDPPSGDKKALEAYAREAKSRLPQSVEVSLDDGRSFLPAKGAASWSFRLETQDYREGGLHVIVRARYLNGASATVKALYFLDKTPPEVEVLSPAEGGRFNGVLALSGRASDQNGLESVGVALRKGDKARYEVPSFIQGLYLDAQGLGATTWQAGVGLTFFGDNVKLQALYGQAPATDANGDAQSFFGDVFGAKLIANLLYLPFDSFFGPDWSFLSTSLGVGADFTYFSQTQAGSGLLVGAVFGQLEFPKLTLAGSGVFKKFSLYTEYQLWVLSSVVSGGFIPKISFGARVGVF